MLSLSHAGHVSLFDFRAFVYSVLRKFSPKCHVLPSVNDSLIMRCPKHRNGQNGHISIVFRTLHELRHSINCIVCDESVIVNSRVLREKTRFRHALVSGNLIEEKSDGYVVRHAVLERCSSPIFLSKEVFKIYGVHDPVLWCDSSWSSDFYRKTAHTHQSEKRSE